MFESELWSMSVLSSVEHFQSDRSLADDGRYDKRVPSYQNIDIYHYLDRGHQDGECSEDYSSNVYIPGILTKSCGQALL